VVPVAQRRPNRTLAATEGAADRKRESRQLEHPRGVPLGRRPFEELFLKCRIEAIAGRLGCSVNSAASARRLLQINELAGKCVAWESIGKRGMATALP
jgi:uncharacterized metal-binding protein